LVKSPRLRIGKPTSSGDSTTHEKRAFPGRNGDRISANDSGARFAKITARMETPGTTSVTTRAVPVLTDGGKTVWQGFPMTNNNFVLQLLYGMVEIRF